MENISGKYSPARKVLVGLAAPALALGLLAGCEVEKTQEGKMPSVDVDVESGQMPKYDVDAPDVRVGMKKETIKVPEVRMVEKEVEVPTVGIDMPDEDGEEVRR